MCVCVVEQDKHWRDVIMEVENNNTHHVVHSPSQEEIKRRDKVWELFRSECVYLIEHILVLKNVRISVETKTCRRFGKSLD